MKSPLRNTSRSQAHYYIDLNISSVATVHSFMLYTGDLELGIATSDRKVVAHTDKQAIYEFWTLIQESPDRIIGLAENIYHSMEDDYYSFMQESWHTHADPLYRAALFYVLNRCSSEGLASCGTLERSGFNPIATMRARNFKNDNISFVRDRERTLSEVVKSIRPTDTLLFPVGDFKYDFLTSASESFDVSILNHSELLDILSQLGNKWIVVYNYHPEVLKLYKDFNVTMLDKYGRVTDKTNCKEIIIGNY